MHVVMTQSATKFVTPLTFEVLSGHPVSTNIFEAHQEMKHLSLPAQVDAIVIAPATANCLAKAALGLSDDLLSTMLLTSQCPLIVAPAMDGGMWTHPSVLEHVGTLRARGTIVVESGNRSTRFRADRPRSLGRGRTQFWRLFRRRWLRNAIGKGTVFWFRLARRKSRSIRCASFQTAPPARWAMPLPKPPRRGEPRWSSSLVPQHYRFREASRSFRSPRLKKC